MSNSPLFGARFRVARSDAAEFALNKTSSTVLLRIWPGIVTERCRVCPALARPSIQWIAISKSCASAMICLEVFGCAA